MADATKIKWTHRPGTKGCTLNPIRALNKKTEMRGWYCEKVCEACRFCYADALNTKAGDTGGTGLPYKPSMREFADIYLDEKTLQQPLHWRSPRTIFWSSMTDAFGPWVSEQWVLRMFAICALTPEHTHIFLTKRAQAMWEHLGIRPVREMLSLLAGPVHDIAIALKGREEGRNWAREALKHWPLPNVWLGVTAGNQQTADERIPLLLCTHAAIRFVSCEPMLGQIDLRKYLEWGSGGPPWLDWVICGGETGPKEKPIRPRHPQWVYDLHAQCEAASVPFFEKQQGEWASLIDRAKDDPDWRANYKAMLDVPGTRVVNLEGGHGFHGERVHIMRRVGKKAAGRLLDVQQFPEARS